MKYINHLKIFLILTTCFFCFNKSLPAYANASACVNGVCVEDPTNASLYSENQSPPVTYYPDFSAEDIIYEPMLDQGIYPYEESYYGEEIYGPDGYEGNGYYPEAQSQPATPPVIVNCGGTSTNVEQCKSDVQRCSQDLQNQVGQTKNLQTENNKLAEDIDTSQNKLKEAQNYISSQDAQVSKLQKENTDLTKSKKANQIKFLIAGIIAVLVILLVAAGFATRRLHLHIRRIPPEPPTFV